MDNNNPERLLRRPEVQQLTALPTSTLYRMLKEGRFPSPVKIGVRAVAWRAGEVADWLADRLAARSEATGQAGEAA